MIHSVGAFEAKTHFAQLIQRVSEGEEIVITKRGHPVVKMVPLTKNHNAKAAAARLRSLAKEIQIGAYDWDEWKGYRDEGRR